MKIFSIIVLFTTMIGCSTTYELGRRFNAQNSQKIVIGTSTKQDIISMFGNPHKKGLANGNSVFVYTHELIKFTPNMFGTHKDIAKKGNTLVIEFDKNDKVKNYYLNVPGKEPVILGVIMIHENKRSEEKRRQHHHNS